MSSQIFIPNQLLYQCLKRHLQWKFYLCTVHTSHPSLQKMHVILCDLKILKITHMLGLCEMRNTLLMSDCCQVVYAREQLLLCTLVLMSNNLRVINTCE